MEETDFVVESFKCHFLIICDHAVQVFRTGVLDYPDIHTIDNPAFSIFVTSQKADFAKFLAD